MPNKKDSPNSTYFERESLPSFLTQERFDELEENLQDYIVFSSRMQYFLQSKIDVNSVDSIINHFKYQMEISYQSLEHLDTISNAKFKDFSAAMESLETGMLNADIMLYMRENYNKEFMKLRVPNWRKDSADN